VVAGAAPRKVHEVHVKLFYYSLQKSRRSVSRLKLQKARLRAIAASGNMQLTRCISSPGKIYLCIRLTELDKIKTKIVAASKSASAE